MITTLLSPDTLSVITSTPVEEINPAFNSITNVFVGIIIGIAAGELYNRFYSTKLPQWLAFFSGRRLVPILTAIVAILLSLILFFVWPVVYGVLQSFGEAISGLGALGAGIYGVLNKLLIPFGLHHAVNNVFWFDTIGINDIGNFWGSTGVQGITGMYQAGFFPIMMFGLPAAALAIYKNALPENKGRVGALMASAAIASFVTGITEPIEFSFMFLSPILYVINAQLTGVSMFVAATLNATAGFSFSAGLIDFVLSSRMPLSNRQHLLIVIGIVMAVLYFFIFDFMIRKFDLQTPGRERVNVETTDNLSESDRTYSRSSSATGDKYEVMANEIYQAVGGADNINSMVNCATRLRLNLKDANLVDSARITQAGVSGQRKIDNHNYHVIVGPDVQFVADPFQERLNKDLKQK